MKTVTYFEIKHIGGGIIGDKNDKFRFETESEALDAAMEFKNNPRSHNKKMSDDNVECWKNRTYTIVKQIVQTEEITTI